MDVTRRDFGRIAMLAVQAVPQAPAAPGAPPAARGPNLPRPEPYDFADHAGWNAIFDGTLKDWDYNPAVWSVENGAITAESSAEKRIGTSYIVWKGGDLADFEFKLELKLGGDVHMGVAYRSWTDPARAATLGPFVPAPGQTPAQGGAGGGAGRAAQPPLAVPVDPRWTLYGPGLDYDADRRNSASVEERGTPRRYLALRGSIVRLEAGKRPRLIGTIGDPDALMNVMKVDDWNQIHVIARGPQMTHIVNGQLMAIAFDEDKTFFTPAGKIGWSIEQFGLGRVSVRDVWIRKL